LEEVAFIENLPLATSLWTIICQSVGNVAGGIIRGYGAPEQNCGGEKDPAEHFATPLNQPDVEIPFYVQSGKQVG